MRRLNFNNRNRGKQPRANALLRLARSIRRKRVAYSRLAAAQALKLAQREIDRFQHLAQAHSVPVDAMPRLPVLPTLPGQEWIEYRQAMGALTPVVRPEHPSSARGQTA